MNTFGKVATGAIFAMNMAFGAHAQIDLKEAKQELKAKEARKKELLKFIKACLGKEFSAENIAELKKFCQEKADNVSDAEGKSEWKSLVVALEKIENSGITTQKEVQELFQDGVPKLEDLSDETVKKVELVVPKKEEVEKSADIFEVNGIEFEKVAPGVGRLKISSLHPVEMVSEKNPKFYQEIEKCLSGLPKWQEINFMKAVKQKLDQAGARSDFKKEWMPGLEFAILDVLKNTPNADYNEKLETVSNLTKSTKTSSRYGEGFDSANQKVFFGERHFMYYSPNKKAFIREVFIQSFDRDGVHAPSDHYAGESSESGVTHRPMSLVWRHPIAKKDSETLTQTEKESYREWEKNFMNKVMKYVSFNNYDNTRYHSSNEPFLVLEQDYWENTKEGFVGTNQKSLAFCSFKNSITTKSTVESTGKTTKHIYLNFLFDESDEISGCMIYSHYGTFFLSEELFASHGKIIDTPNSWKDDEGYDSDVTFSYAVCFEDGTWLDLKNMKFSKTKPAPPTR